LIATSIHPGDPLLLVREPDNTYDQNAILVMVRVAESPTRVIMPNRQGGKLYRLGYVPAPLAAGLAPLMDAGTKLKATFRGGTGFNLNVEVHYV
jgi:hypothetical protein